MNIGKIYNRSEARKKLPSLVDEVNDSGGTIYISERGEKQAVLISYKVFKKLYKDGNQAKKLLTYSGIWRDRDDVKNSVDWVNTLREKNRRKFR